MILGPECYVLSRLPNYEMTIKQGHDSKDPTWTIMQSKNGLLLSKRLL